MLEPEEGEAVKKLPWLWIGMGALALIVIVVVGMRQASTPAPVAAKPAEPETPKPAPPPPPKARTAQEILALAKPSVAGILAYEVSGQAVPQGSGILVAPDAIVTTCHGLPAGGQIVARIGADALPASLVVTDEVLNLCRLSVPRLEAPVLAAGGEEPKAGDVVFAVGQHQGTEISVVEGKIKDIKTAAGARVIELSMPVAVAASGGALFDAYGRLIGVLTNRHRAGSNFALPSAAIAQMRTRGRAEAAKPQ